MFTPPGGSPPGVLVLHGDAGLDDTIRAHARRLADQGYLVLALDLFRGEAADGEHKPLRLPEARVRGDIKAAVDWLIEQSAEENRGVGVIGWELGGGYALDAAIADPRIVACVTCYGRLTTDPALLGKMKASVLAVFAGKDAAITPETRQAFSQALTKAKKSFLKPLVFHECDRGFMNPTPDRKPGPKDDASTRESWRHIDVFFREKLRP